MNDDVFGRSVSMTSSGGYDYYLVGGSFEFVFPTGTSENAAYLSMAKQTQLSRFQAAMQAFVLDRYPLETRWGFIALLNDANQNILLINRRAYIQQIFTWTKAIITYSATYAASINAMSDPATIAGTSWDLSTLAASDPMITLIAAVQIGN